MVKPKRKYRAEWYDEFGKRKRKMFFYKDQRDEFLRQEMRKVDDIKKLGAPKRKTFSEYCGEWLLERQNECLERNKPATYDWYEMVVRHHLIPLFGDIYLSDLKVEHMVGVKAHFLAKKLSSRSVIGYMTTLGAILKSAKKRLYCNQDLALHLEKPELIAARDNKRPFDHEEIELFFSLCPPRYQLFYAIAFFTGMRSGEILALKKGDLDQRKWKFYVDDSYSGPKKRLTSTKTHMTRSVDVTDHLRPFFASWRCTKDEKESLIFPTFTIPNLRNRVWMKILDEMKVAYRKPSVTRHTFASIMLSEGQSPMWVANTMGDDLETVLQNYAQYIPTDYKPQLMQAVKIGQYYGQFLDTGTDPVILPFPRAGKD